MKKYKNEIIKLAENIFTKAVQDLHKNDTEMEYLECLARSSFGFAFTFYYTIDQLDVDSIPDIINDSYNEDFTEYVKEMLEDTE